jgi:hypothetical protein
MPERRLRRGRGGDLRCLGGEALHRDRGERVEGEQRHDGYRLHVLIVDGGTPDIALRPELHDAV